MKRYLSARNILYIDVDAVELMLLDGHVMRIRVRDRLIASVAALHGDVAQKACLGVPDDGRLNNVAVDEELMHRQLKINRTIADVIGLSVENALSKTEHIGDRLGKHDVRIAAGLGRNVDKRVLRDRMKPDVKLETERIQKRI